MNIYIYIHTYTYSRAHTHTHTHTPWARASPCALSGPDDPGPLHREEPAHRRGAAE